MQPQIPGLHRLPAHEPGRLPDWCDACHQLRTARETRVPVSPFVRRILDRECPDSPRPLPVRS